MSPQVSWGRPAGGYQDSIAKQFVAPGKLVVGSAEVQVEPRDGRYARRGGTHLFQDNGGAGLIEQSFATAAAVALARPRRVRQFPFRGLKAGTFAIYVDKFGVNKGFFYEGAEALPVGEILGTLAAGGVSATEQVTFAHLAGRGQTATQRATIVLGSADARAIGSFVHIGGYSNTPVRWNCEDGAAGTRKIVRSWGNPSPARMPRIDHTGGESATDGKFVRNQFFAVAVAYRKADGSISRPLMPYVQRQLDTIAGTPQATCWNRGGWETDNFGYYSVATALQYAQSCRVFDIPVGGPDVTGRVFFRTLQASSLAAVDLNSMAYWFEVRDNVATEARTSIGDGELVLDSQLFRLDHMMAPRSKYMAVHEGRVWVAYTQPSNLAVLVCPNVNAPVANTVNAPGTSKYNGVAYSGRVFAVQVENALDFDVLPAGVDVRVTLWVAANAAAAGVALAQLTVNAGSQTTLRDMVDYFNSQAAGAVANVVGGTVDAGVHMVLAPNFPSQTPVRALMSTSSSLDVLFAPAKVGVQRIFSESFPGHLFVNDARMDWAAEVAHQRRAVAFTSGGQRHPLYAANSFYVGNVRFMPDGVGDVIGIASAREGLVVFCTKGAYVIVNTKDFNTNLDEDYTVRELNRDLRFIAPDTVFETNGVCGALASTGLIATDGAPLSEVMLSEDLYDDVQKTGFLAYEIAQCEAASQADQLWNAHALVTNDGTSLWLAVRRNGLARPDTLFRYPYGMSRAKIGLASMLDGEGRKFGWSAPCAYNPSFGAGGVGPVVQTVRTIGIETKRRLLMYTGYVGAAAGGSIVEIETPDYLDYIPGSGPVGGYVAVMRPPPLIASPDADVRGLVLSAEYALGAGGVAYLQLLLDEAENVSGESYQLDVAGDSATMRSAVFDVSIVDKIHARRLALQIVSTAGALYLWGADLSFSEHRRRRV